MAKVKAKKKSTKKVGRKSSNKKSSVKRASSKRPKSSSGSSLWSWFVHVLFFVLFIYAGWLLWSEPWTQGISLIVALLIIMLVAKFIKKRR
jgi:Flp pilus assembly protein TadB